MRVGVPESVRVNLRGVKAGQLSAHLDAFPYAIGCESAALTEEQGGAGCVPVFGALT